MYIESAVGILSYANTKLFPIQKTIGWQNHQNVFVILCGGIKYKKNKNEIPCTHIKHFQFTEQWLKFWKDDNSIIQWDKLAESEKKSLKKEFGLLKKNFLQARHKKKCVKK